MNRNCYIQIREFGAVGWNKLLPTLFLADRLDTWIPLGAHLREAHAKGLCPFSEHEFIKMIELGWVRAGVREDNLVPNPKRPMFNVAGDSLLDDFLLKQYRRGDSSCLVVHPEYDSARVALEAIENSRHAPPDSHYAIARMYVDRHMKGEANVLPPSVLERAAQFGSMDFQEIKNDDITDCVKLIRGVRDAEERQALMICSQLIRLAIEHDRLKRAHQCDLFFAQQDFASLFQHVARTEPFARPPLGPLHETVERIAELIDFLLAQNPVRDLDDFANRREKLAKYSDVIWRLASYNDEVDVYLAGEISPDRIGPLDALGSDTVGRVLSGAAWLARAIAFLLGGSSPGSIASMGFPAASAVRNLLKARDERMGDARFLGVIVYGEDVLNVEQVRAILRDLEYRINKRGG